MGKESALGHDPLSWMKVGKESKKTVSSGDDNAAEQNATRSDQPSGFPTTKKQDIPSPTNDVKTLPIQKPLQPPDKIDTRASIASVPKQKVVIGRLYEKPSAEKTKPRFHDEQVPHGEQGASQAPGRSMPTPSRVQPIQRSESTINRVPFTLSAERTSTYIVVAYTALLLVLGYFVYSDLSKRTSRIEARLFAIEKALRLKQR